MHLCFLQWQVFGYTDNHATWICSLKTAIQGSISNVFESWLPLSAPPGSTKGVGWKIVIWIAPETDRSGCQNTTDGRGSSSVYLVWSNLQDFFGSAHRVNKKNLWVYSQLWSQWKTCCICPHPATEMLKWRRSGQAGRTMKILGIRFGKGARDGVWPSNNNFSKSTVLVKETWTVWIQKKRAF